MPPLGPLSPPDEGQIIREVIGSYSSRKLPRLLTPKKSVSSKQPRHVIPCWARLALKYQVLMLYISIIGDFKGKIQGFGKKQSLDRLGGHLHGHWSLSHSLSDQFITETHHLSGVLRRGGKPYLPEVSLPLSIYGKVQNKINGEIWLCYC